MVTNINKLKKKIKYQCCSKIMLIDKLNDKQKDYMSVARLMIFLRNM